MNAVTALTRFRPGVRSSFLLMLVPLLATLPARSEPVYYAIDPVHTSILFFVEHARFARSVGRFRPVQGGLWFDEDDWTNSRVELCLPLDALDMGDRGWENTLRRRDWFDGKPVCFRSTGVERLDEQRGRLLGQLTVRSQSRPVAFEFTINDVRRYSLTFRRRMGVSARGEFSRADFGMTRDTTLVGDTVEVMIELEAQVADPPADEHAGPRSDRRTR